LSSSIRISWWRFPLGSIPSEEVEFLKAADEQTKERLWDHAAHENVVFNDRLNFFLLFESVSLGVIGALYSRSPADNTPLQFLAFLGLLISLLWLYVQARQKNILNSVRARNAVALPEYAFILRNRRKWPPSTTWLLGYFLPLVVLLIRLSDCRRWCAAILSDIPLSVEQRPISEAIP
jgi:hypothetical protein